MIALANEDVDQGECNSIAGESASLYNHFDNQFGIFFRKLGRVQPQDPSVLLLGMDPKDAPQYNKNIYSTMFIVLFVIARNWKQSRMDKENVVYLHIRILFSY